MSTLTTFYKNYVRLCAKKGVSASAAAEGVGLSRTSPNGWKSGKNPSDTTLAKLAAYFGVSVDDLILEQKEKLTAESSSELSELDKKLHNAITQIQDEEKKRWLLKMIQSLSEEE